jgi:triphosphoribosyl-dephospho-CoA synthetase
MSEARKVMWRNIFQGVLLLLIGLCFGYGTSQQFVVSEVKIQAVEIKHLQLVEEKQDSRMQDMEKLITTRIGNLANLMEENMKQTANLMSRNMDQTSELITIIRTERGMQPHANIPTK